MLEEKETKGRCHLCEMKGGQKREETLRSVPAIAALGRRGGRGGGIC